MNIEEIVKKERQFRKKLMNIKPKSATEAIFLPLFLNQSILAEILLLNS